jgi:acetolactate synthase-1/2/3 large subunit
MTGLELLTATTEGAGVVIFVFHDGELSQIAQGQEIPYNRKTCTVLGEVKLEGIALATGARYLALDRDEQLAAVIAEALAAADRGQPVLVDVRIDYSKRTRFTQGVVQTVLKRFPLGDKVRFIGRALIRKVTG